MVQNEKTETYKQMEKRMALMRKEVMLCKKDSNIPLLHEYVKDFEKTFKKARGNLLRPENEFPLVSKRKIMEMAMNELFGFHAGVLFLAMKKENETELLELEDMGGLKNESLIKEAESDKIVSKKKEIEIKGEQMQISIRGGRRAGAGRKSIGVKKPVSITLPVSVWDEIDSVIQSGKYKSYADYFRSLIS